MLYKGLEKYKEFFILPKATDKSEPSWFGFPITVRKDAPFTRIEITEFLEDNKIATRLIFSGNITKHPSFDNVNYRVHGNLENTDFIMKNTFWLGVYPGLSDEMINYIIEKIDEFKLYINGE